MELYPAWKTLSRKPGQVAKDCDSNLHNYPKMLQTVLDGLLYAVGTLNLRFCNDLEIQFFRLHDFSWLSPFWRIYFPWCARIARIVKISLSLSWGSLSQPRLFLIELDFHKKNWLFTASKHLGRNWILFLGILFLGRLSGAFGIRSGRVRRAGWGFLPEPTNGKNCVLLQNVLLLFPDPCKHHSIQESPRQCSVQPTHVMFFSL